MSQETNIATALEILNEPGRVVISVTDAAAVLGIAKSTAHNAYMRTGYLCDGVPVIRVGKRCIVSIAALKNALGLS
tara:strand:- start:1140 stop:1367 length:228 start_codon:yes stop_codon:yes gene_type:complete